MSWGKRMRIGHTMAAAVAVSGVALAQGDVAQQIVNDPSTPQVDGAGASLRNDAAVQGGKALRIEVARRATSVGRPGRRPHPQAGQGWRQSGPRLLGAARERRKGRKRHDLALQCCAARVGALLDGHQRLRRGWTRVETAAGHWQGRQGLSGERSEGDELLATARQQVDFGPIVVLDQGR